MKRHNNFDEKTTKNSLLLKEMDKYDFKKAYKVSLSIIDSDIIDNELNLLEPVTDSGENGRRSESERLNGNDQVTNVNFQRTHTNQTHNNNTGKHNVYNAPTNCSINVDTQIVCPRNEYSTELSIPYDQTINSQNIEVQRNWTSSYVESNNKVNKSYNELDILASNIIGILKAYEHYCFNKRKFKNSELLLVKNLEYYISVKKESFHICRDIIIKTILPQGKKFNTEDFLHKTTHIANSQERLFCSIENVRNVYNDIIRSFSLNIPSHEACRNPTNVNYAHALQQQFQNNGPFNNVTETSYKEPQFSEPQKNLECCTHTSNVSQKKTNGSNALLQYNGLCNIVTQTIDKVPNPTLQQSSHDNWPCSNIVSSNISRSCSTWRDHAQIEFNNNNVTMTSDSTSVLQQNGQNVEQSNIIMQKQSYFPNSTLLELLQSDECYNKESQATNNTPYSVLDTNTKNCIQSTNTIERINERPSSIFQQNVQHTLQCNNQQSNCSGQNTLEDPTINVFSFGIPNFEIRLDVDPRILNNVNRLNQFNNNSLPVDNINNANKLYTSEDIRKPSQSTCPEASQILQEPNRSASRDSGIMSPTNNQIGDFIGEEQNSKSPYITHVTSLNPRATYIALGPCHVCKQPTTKKCLGCFKYYYCTSKCQIQDWSKHKYDCWSTKEQT